MERKVLNIEQHVSFLYDELEKKEEEIDNLKNKLDEAIDKARQKAATHLKDQDDISEMKKVIEEQKIKIMCLRKHRDDILNRHENTTIDDYEKEFKEKEEALKNEIKCLEQRSTDEKEVKNEMFIGNKLTIDDIKRQYEYENFDEKKDLDEKKPTFEDKLMCSKQNAKSEQSDDLSRKENRHPESKNIEDFHYEDTSLIPGKHTVDFNTGNLHDIITHLKDENEHLRLKSKLQKETRDKLEKKICLLKKQVKESGKTQTKNICDEEEKYVQIKRLEYQEQTIRKQESEFTNKKNDISQYDSRSGDQKKNWLKRKRLCTSKSSINGKHLKYHH